MSNNMQEVLERAERLRKNHLGTPQTASVYPFVSGLRCAERLLTVDSRAAVAATAALAAELVWLSETLGVREALDTSSPIRTLVKTPAGVFSIEAISDGGLRSDGAPRGVPGVILAVFRRRIFRRPVFVTAFRPGEHAAAFWLLTGALSAFSSALQPCRQLPEEAALECVTYDQHGAVVGREPVKGTK